MTPETGPDGGRRDPDSPGVEYPKMKPIFSKKEDVERWYRLQDIWAKHSHSFDSESKLAYMRLLDKARSHPGHLTNHPVYVDLKRKKATWAHVIILRELKRGEFFSSNAIYEKVHEVYPGLGLKEYMTAYNFCGSFRYKECKKTNPSSPKSGDTINVKTNPIEVNSQAEFAEPRAPGAALEDIGASTKNLEDSGYQDSDSEPMRRKRKRLSGIPGASSGTIDQERPQKASNAASPAFRSIKEIEVQYQTDRQILGLAPTFWRQSSDIDRRAEPDNFRGRADQRAGRPRTEEQFQQFMDALEENDKLKKRIEELRGENEDLRRAHVHLRQNHNQLQLGQTELRRQHTKQQGQDSNFRAFTNTKLNELRGFMKKVNSDRESEHKQLRAFVQTQVQELSSKLASQEKLVGTTLDSVSKLKSNMSRVENCLDMMYAERARSVRNNSGEFMEDEASQMMI